MGAHSLSVATVSRCPSEVLSDGTISNTVAANDLFDAGLWTIDDDLYIRVARSDISESILPGGSHFKLSDLHGRPLSFNPSATLRPNPAHLAWHRREVFGCG